MSMQLGKETVHFWDRMSADERKAISGEHYGAFHAAVGEMVRDNVLLNVGHLIDRLFKSEQFSDELSDLASRKADPLEVAEAEGYCVVDGTKDAFYFNWDDLTSVECTGSHDCMVDFHAFAKANGLDLSNFVMTSDDNVAVSGTVLGEDEEALPGDVLEGLFANTSPDGWDVTDTLSHCAGLVGLTKLQDDLKAALKSKHMAEKLFGEFVNKDFVSGQSYSDVEEAAQGAIDDNRIETSDHDQDVLEHWVVDPWFGARLREHGETVVDFENMEIWGRCTSGQVIAMDGVIEQVFIAEMPYRMDALVREVMPEVAARIEAEVEQENQRLKAEQANAADAPSLR